MSARGVVALLRALADGTERGVQVGWYQMVIRSVFCPCPGCCHVGLEVTVVCCSGDRLCRSARALFFGGSLRTDVECRSRALSRFALQRRCTGAHLWTGFVRRRHAAAPLYPHSTPQAQAVDAFPKLQPIPITHVVQSQLREAAAGLLGTIALDAQGRR